MRRGGGEHAALVLTRGWIIHPLEKSASPPCVCFDDCLSKCGYTLPSSCTCGNVFCLATTTHTHRFDYFASFYAWFSLSSADAKWLSVLCMLSVVRFIGCEVRYSAVKQKGTTMYSSWIISCFFSNFIQTDRIPISDLFDRQSLLDLKYSVCGSWEWEIEVERARGVHREMHDGLLCM